MDTGHWITISIAFVGYTAILIKIIVSMQVRIKSIEIKQEMQDKQDERIMMKLDEISKKLNRIELELQNKQNRS